MDSGTCSRRLVGMTGLLFSLLLGCSGGDQAGADKADSNGGKKSKTTEASAKAATPKSKPEKEAPKKVKITDSAQWTDEVGNLVKFRDNPDLVNPDIVAVDVSSADGKLVVVYKFAEGNLEKCFTQKNGNPPMPFGSSVSEFHLDLDNDPATGAKVGRAENEQGYELKLSVMTGFGFVDKDSGDPNAMFGDIGFPENLVNLKPDASTTMWGIGENSQELPYWKLSYDEQNNLPREYTVVGKDQIVMSIPYAWFKMKSGDVIRVAYTDEKSLNDDLSEVRRVRLK